jgi:hypothetical protein
MDVCANDTLSIAINRAHEVLFLLDLCLLAFSHAKELVYLYTIYNRFLASSFLCMNVLFQAFNLYDIQPPAIPTVTLSLRHRTSHVRQSQHKITYYKTSQLCWQQNFSAIYN